MKIMYPLLCVYIILSSCEKDCIKPIGISGNWIWDKSVSTWGTWSPENSGERRELKIDDYYYKEFLNDSLVFESQYDLVIRIDSIYGPQSYIVFPSGYEEGISFNESNLVRVETMYIDGFTHYYHRK